MAESGRLRALEKARKDRAAWAQRARRWLPAELSSHLVAASLGAGSELVLSFDSSTWAARARYLAPTITTRARDELGESAPAAVKVRVHPRGGHGG